MSMTMSRRWALRAGLSMAALAFGGLVIGLSGLRVSCAGGETYSNPGIVRQVTVFAIVATPKGESVDNKLSTIRAQLSKLLPQHGFKLLDSRSAPIVAGESVECNPGHGYTVEITMVRPIDENGKVELRCDLSLDNELQFSATVRAPLDQLFFCERPFLTDGSKLLIGVGAGMPPGRSSSGRRSLSSASPRSVRSSARGSRARRGLGRERTLPGAVLALDPPATPGHEDHDRQPFGDGPDGHISRDLGPVRRRAAGQRLRERLGRQSGHHLEELPVRPVAVVEGCFRILDGHLILDSLASSRRAIALSVRR